MLQAAAGRMLYNTADMEKGAAGEGDSAEAVTARQASAEGASVSGRHSRASNPMALR